MSADFILRRKEAARQELLSPFYRWRNLRLQNIPWFVLGKERAQDWSVFIHTSLSARTWASRPGLVFLTASAGLRAQSFSHVQFSCDPTDCSPPGSSVHGILQAIILEWVAKSFSRGFFRARDRTRTSCISCTGRWILHHWATVEVHQSFISFRCF